MRLSTEFWVSAYLRQSQLAGDFAAPTRKGAAHGGAIFIIINRLDGTADLYAPAPQAMIEEDTNERVFYQVLEAAGQEEISKKIEKEINFDSDLWVIERESRAAQHDLVVVTLTRD